MLGERCKDWDDWDKPAPPVRIHGNTYLVGTCGIASILITGDEGDILIDGGTEAGADLIAANIRELGFNVRDVRIMLHSHEHFDHVGGIARLQRLSGAQLVASRAAAEVLADGRGGRRRSPGRDAEAIPAGAGRPRSSRTASKSGSATCC